MKALERKEEASGKKEVRVRENEEEKRREE